MARLGVFTNGDGCWPDLKGRIGSPDVFHVREGFDVALLPGGMQSGRASVMVRVNLPDGRVVLAETSLELFLTAARIFSTAKEGAP